MGHQKVDPDLNHKLQQRGISDETRAAFGIRSYSDGLTGWVYPTLAGGLRFKNADSNGKPKYAWLDPITQRLKGGHKPAGDTYYHAPHFADMVKANGGRAWVVSGEPDVWAKYSAGKPAFSFGYGEGGNIPDDLPDFCLRMGITDLRAAPDLDQTGQGWANRIAGKVGSLLTAHRLPHADGSKYDIGKAWAEWQGGDFEAWLMELPTLEIQPQKPPVKRAAGVILLGGLFDQWNQLIYAEYENRRQGNRKHIHCPNPDHADHNPSFRIDPLKGPICTCDLGGKNKRDNVAQWLGLPTYAEYRKQHHENTRRGGGVARSQRPSHPPLQPITPTNQHVSYNTPEPTPDEWLPPVESLFEGRPLANDYIFAQGIPDIVRKCLLNIDQLDLSIRFKGAKAKRYFKNHTPALIIYELIHRGAAAGELNPRAFTRDNLRACAGQNGLTITEYTLRLGLDQLGGMGFLRNLHPIEIQENTMGAKIENNPPDLSMAGGRPVDTFTLLPIRQAVNTLLSRVETAIRQAVYADTLADLPTNIETDGQLVALLSEVDSETARRSDGEPTVSKLYGKWVDDLNPVMLATAQSTPLAAGFDWGSKAGYTDAYNRGKLDAAGGERQIANKILAFELGCSENALRASNRRANILSLENYEHLEIEPGASRQKIENALLGRGRAWWIADGFEHEKVVRPERLRHEIDHMADIVEKGGTVTIRVQTASKHTPSTPEQIEAVTNERRAKLQAIRNYKAVNTPPDAAPIQQDAPPPKFEAAPRPADTLADGLTLQYILDQYSLRIKCLDYGDQRREKLVNRFVQLGGDVLSLSRRDEPHQSDEPLITPANFKVQPTSAAATEKPEWVKRLISKKPYERGA